MAVTARMLEALNGLLQRERPVGALPGVLLGARDTGGLRGPQNSLAVGGLIGISNARLSSVKTRFEGLCLLSFLVGECPTDHFQQHCVAWLRSVQHTIQSQDSPPTMELAVFILYDLLKYSSLLPELAREISMNHIPGLLTSLLGLKLECQTPALNGMKACMTFYPRACGSLRGKLASCFLSLLDTDNPRLQQLACECYTLLPSLGSGFSHGVKYTECWEHQLHTLLATLHGIVGNIYEGAETDPVLYEGPGLELQMPKTDNDDSNTLLHLKNRFTAISKCICLLLSSDFSAPVTVPVQDLLDVICRVLNISNRSLSWLGDGPLKMLLLPAIHIDVLNILGALILACGARLVRFASVLCRLFTQVLTAWSALRDLAIPGQEKPYSAVRTKTYNIVELWIKVCGASSGVLQGSAHHSDVLLAHLLADITPSLDTIKLKAGHLGAEVTGNTGKPASKKPKMADLDDSPGLQSHRKQDANANSDVCSAALRVLSRAILLSGSLIKEETHKRLHELVVPLLIRLQQSVGIMSSPYSCAECRKELYRLLLCLQLAPNPRLPPPLHCAVRLFSLGQAEKNTEVLSFCAEALVISNCLIHPRVPSLQIPIISSSSANADFYKPPVQIPTEVQSPFRHTVPTPVPISSASPQQPNHIALPLQGNALISRLPPSMIPAPVVPSCSIGTEHHNSVPHTGEDPLLQDMHSPSDELFGGKAHRPVFIHYEKEEASDVEISLESDSDDSVVIVPEGFLTKPPEAPSPPKVVNEVEEATKEATVVPATTTAMVVSVQPVPPPILAPALPPPPPTTLPAPPPQQATENSTTILVEDLTVININSSDEEEEDEDEFQEDDEFFDEEDDYDEEFDEDLEEEEEEEGEGEVGEMEGMEDEELEEEYEGEEEMMSDEEDELPQDVTSEMLDNPSQLELKQRMSLQQQAVLHQKAILQQKAAFQKQMEQQVEQVEREQQLSKEQQLEEEDLVEEEEEEEERFERQQQVEQQMLAEQVEEPEQVEDREQLKGHQAEPEQEEELEHSAELVLQVEQEQLPDRELQSEQTEQAQQGEREPPVKQELQADLEEKANLQDEAELMNKEAFPEKEQLLENVEHPQMTECQEEELEQKVEPQLNAVIPTEVPVQEQLVEEKLVSQPETMEVGHANEQEAVEMLDEAPPHLSPVRAKEDQDLEQDEDLEQDTVPDEEEEHEGDTDLFMTVESDGGEKFPEEEEEEMEREQPPVLPRETQKIAPTDERLSPPPLPATSPPPLPPLPVEPEIPELEQGPETLEHQKKLAKCKESSPERKAFPILEEKMANNNIMAEEIVNSAESMLADFIDCPPDEERDSPPGTSS